MNINMDNKVVFFVCIIVCSASEIAGYAAWCDANRTSIVPEGFSATVQAVVSDFHIFDELEFQMTNPVSRYLARSRLYHYSEMRFYDDSLGNRTEFVVNSNNDSHDSYFITVSMSNISKLDNGTYTIKGLFSGDNICWTVLVMEMHTVPNSVIEEKNPVYIYAQPRASLIKRSLVNATMMWLLDGLSTNQTGAFIEQDGYIWIASVGRELSGKNVTYRATQDDGNVTDAILTLYVTYGPLGPLTLIPEKRYYHLTTSDVMPDVTCHADCNPACLVSWGEHGSGNVLSLGKVTINSIGDYTCEATRPDVNVVVKESITIYVTDEPSVTMAIAMLASVQAVTTLILGMCAVCMCVRRKGRLCHNCINNSCRTSSDSGIDNPKPNETVPVEMEHYENLNTETRVDASDSYYGQVNYAIQGTNRDNRLENYENTQFT